MTLLSPDLTPSSTLLDHALALDLTTCIEPLIPGLPDDIALHILLRVSVNLHMACKAVCKRWYSLFHCKDHFFTKRKELGFLDPWLFVLTSDKHTRKINFRVLDLTTFSWHTIPPMPIKGNVNVDVDVNVNVNVSPQGFICVSIPLEGVLYVCGGVISDAHCPLNLVLKYEVIKNRWTVMNKMTTPRSFFAIGVIGGMIYVAGGNGPSLFELGSTEVLDPITDTWRNIANMCTNMASYDCVVLDGKLLVTEGWFWPFNVRPIGLVYDPLVDQWEEMAVGLREGWTGSGVVVYGCLFMVTEHEGMKLKVYNKESDSWCLVEGESIPEMISKPFCVSSWGCEIYVVGEILNVAVGRVVGSFCGERWRFCVEWKLVEACESLFGLTPSNAQVLLA